MRTALFGAALSGTYLSGMTTSEFSRGLRTASSCLWNKVTWEYYFPVASIPCLSSRLVMKVLLFSTIKSIRHKMSNPLPAAHQDRLVTNRTPIDSIIHCYLDCCNRINALQEWQNTSYTILLRPNFHLSHANYSQLLHTKWRKQRNVN